MPSSTIMDRLVTLPPLDHVQLSGLIGERLNTVIAARMTSPLAQGELFDEAVGAFRNRVDDKIEPGTGRWQGEFWGKWVLSLIGAYRYSGDELIHQTITCAVDGLLATQDADGYIGTYTDSSFIKGDNWNVWCRKYTLWGLVEAAELLEREDVLQAACRMMDHLMTQVGPDQLSILDAGRFAGLPSSSILSPLIRLYRGSGDERYLDYARWIVTQWSSVEGQPPDLLRKGLSGQLIPDWFEHPEQWTKAYELISCVEGMVDLYQVTGVEDLLTAAANIFHAIRASDRVIQGGIGRNDKLLHANRLVQSETEICDAVYWVRLATALFTLTGDVIYAEEIDRTLQNILLTATNADGTWGLRRACLMHEHWPAPPHCQLKHHHCCVNNFPRGLLQVAQLAVATSDAGAMIQLYLPGTFELQNKLELNIQTTYPLDGAVTIDVQAAPSHCCEIALRIPQWSQDTQLAVNGEVVTLMTVGTYHRITRTWQAGDQITLQLDMRGRIQTLPPHAQADEITHVGIQRGPMLLARDIRLDEANIHGRVLPTVALDEPVTLEPVVTADGILGVWRCPQLLNAQDNKPVLLCVYASAGSTWSTNSSDFRLWLPLHDDESVAIADPQNTAV